ncbi:MAG: hypothetical protein K2G71_06525, partial [Duncaniella sp.]|nr:hypothetical protein [Duncaniella sp.]
TTFISNFQQTVATYYRTVKICPVESGHSRNPKVVYIGHRNDISGNLRSVSTAGCRKKGQEYDE